ncbi:hypothetical protein [Burkholderia thailandensis]|uniref:hypothetical protein n=1 Tax=Burkholderia thailandensis TaxID=57975 RepID=UPI00046CF458|nr:hypothetical protein [Burkholderia thailandensis]AOJ52207.1 hypothetical protein AQ475_16170 [Burkholderia thailandensis]AVR24561.1 hypothetical protein A8H32_04935 [Burkholderia thailandensis]MCZ2903264.1 hypothetical protein [Burkholderia thailandensis]MDD1484029.1 hypothetical protein [Burkholderia thailandensis]MDD1490228.1 hypothetical protein [Burkholderia thailandensis]
MREPVFAHGCGSAGRTADVKKKNRAAIARAARGEGAQNRGPLAGPRRGAGGERAGWPVHERTRINR